MANFDTIYDSTCGVTASWGKAFVVSLCLYPDAVCAYGARIQRRAQARHGCLPSRSLHAARRVLQKVLVGPRSRVAKRHGSGLRAR